MKSLLQKRPKHFRKIFAGRAFGHDRMNDESWLVDPFRPDDPEEIDLICDGDQAPQ
jgi:hypothetical protein